MFEVVSGSENHAHDVITNDQGISEHRDAEDGTSPTDQEEALTIKIAAGVGKIDDGPMSILAATVAPEATSPSRPSDEDAASTHSLPVTHIAETPSTQSRPSTARLDSSASPGLPSPAVFRSQRYTTGESTATSGERPNRHRNNLESRASNRLSGFFSNLIHRRDALPSTYSRNGLREERASSPALVDSTSAPPSRPSSPLPNRPITPPPPLPSPTLQELGLSLTVITSDLSPSHFSTPPSSGAFLAPHYLLLCHAQGLDVLPLVSPPAPQPYALVRRVSFKSVVVMEQRGVLVAIAGRRDGVRVYALEEVKKAVEWRMEVEIRRERERTRREEAKKAAMRNTTNTVVFEQLNSSEKNNARLMPPVATALPLSTQSPSTGRTKLNRKSSQSTTASSVDPTPRTPRTPTRKKSKSSPHTTPTPDTQFSSQEPPGRPPPYSNTLDTRPQLRSSTSVVSLSRTRRSSTSNVLAPAPSISRRKGDASPDPDSKADDWIEGRGSDDEAIDIVAAGASGSQALDERTSARQQSVASPHGIETTPIALGNSSRTQALHTSRRSRPANLDLSLTRAIARPVEPIAPIPPSPTPTLLSLRQALHQPPPVVISVQPSTRGGPSREQDTPEPELDEDDEEAPARETVSLAQILLESRIPDLPPAGTRQPQQAILIRENNPPSSPGSPTTPGPPIRPSTVGRSDNRRRRRWSVLDGFFSVDSSTAQIPPSSSTAMSVLPTALPSPTGLNILSADRRDRRGSQLMRSHSSRQSSSTTHLPSRPINIPPRPSSAGTGHARPPVDANIPPVPSALTISTSTTSTHSRFIPRIISNAFHSRRSEEQPQTLIVKTSETADVVKRTAGTPTAGHAPPPKLEYVKLPGTKGALIVKSVETAKKSFLAILCGENGEKVELFAGTYRTALGLSRTFILPDSPRSLELQLQGDDLVEVFLVFAQNVFGLEPATVRVREVRIGRAERRAARRRAREIRSGSADVFDTDPPGPDEEDTNVNINIGVSVAPGTEPVVSTSDPATPSSPPSAAHTPEASQTPVDSTRTSSHAEELVASATAQIGPYTTFQQLSFAPNFPLASIADEYIIPPTYPEFLDYRAEHEPEVNGSSNVDLAQVQFSPPGLPVPVPCPPSKWFYRDPKGVVHGPWKESRMHVWYKEGLLPPDLPVRREEDTEYILLKDLRLQSVDPTHPFRSIPPPLPPQSLSAAEDIKPLLHPLSLLSQPKHYGPPALFFSSRGGHSTTIVDSRGRSVLKGRFVWSTDEHDDEKPSLVGKMGDVKRLEAFDVRDRAVIVAMRHGGLEAMDLGDALLKPADESRTVLPQFAPLPSHTNRRGPFVWRIGTPITSSLASSAALSNKSKGSLLSAKKQNTGAGKSPARTEISPGGDGESDSPEEVMFLGRKRDEMYLCERNAGTFRILRLAPNS